MTTYKAAKRQNDHVVDAFSASAGDRQLARALRRRLRNAIAALEVVEREVPALLQVRKECTGRRLPPGNRLEIASAGADSKLQWSSCCREVDEAREAVARALQDVDELCLGLEHGPSPTAGAQ
ncbi:MAG: hypothetical protein ACRDFX_07045 [Chloroflexota bacterium]